MADFKVKVYKLNKIGKHPNADSLWITQIAGENVIFNSLEDGSPIYKENDLVVYIPENSVLPEWLLKELGFWNEEKGKGTLSGSAGNRVKACKLRGIYSCGLVYPVKTNKDFEELNIPEAYDSNVHFLHKRNNSGDVFLSNCSSWD